MHPSLCEGVSSTGLLVQTGFFLKEATKPGGDTCQPSPPPPPGPEVGSTPGSHEGLDKGPPCRMGVENQELPDPRPWSP